MRIFTKVFFVWFFLLQGGMSGVLPETARAEEFPTFQEGIPTPSEERVVLLQTSSKIYTPDDLFQYIDGQADQFIAFGFINLKVVEYMDVPGKKYHVTVELYRMKSSLAAFGVYSSGRFEEAQYTEHGTEGFLSGPVLVFFKGDYYVKISCFAGDLQRQRLALEQLAEIVDGSIPGHEKYPPEIDFILRAGIDPRTVSYGEQGLLGYDFLPPGFQMKSTVDGEEHRFFAGICSDEFTAQEALRSYIGAMRLEHRAIQERVFKETKIWEVEDPYHGMVMLLANKNILAGVINVPENPEEALEILIKLAFN